MIPGGMSCIYVYVYIQVYKNMYLKVSIVCMECYSGFYSINIPVCKRE
jgi:hypothetical protein